MLFLDPEDKLSKPITLYPLDKSKSTILLPIKPAHPETKAALLIINIKQCSALCKL